MTRKDYVALAEAINKARARVSDLCPMVTFEFNAGARKALEVVEESIVDDLESDNPRFDRTRFLAACRGRWKGARS